MYLVSRNVGENDHGIAQERVEGVSPGLNTVLFYTSFVAFKMTLILVKSTEKHIRNSCNLLGAAG